MPRFKLKSKDYLNAPERKRHFNERLFSAIAKEYGRMSRILSFGRDAKWKSLLIERIPEHKNPKCLDLACGDGDLTELLLQKYPNATIAALDLTEPMLALARERLNDDKRIQFLQKDMTATGLPDVEFDIVTVGYGLRNAPELDAALREVRRVLKPGGVVAVLDFSRSSKRLVAAAQIFLLRAWCGAWGLIRSRNADTYGYIADSLAKFPDRANLHRQFTDHGLAVECSQRHFMGFVETIVAKRIEKKNP